MKHAYTAIWVHVIFATHRRARLILPAFRAELHAHLAVQLRAMDCLPAAINGTDDHVHLLLALNSGLSVAEVVKQLKGESSHWINRRDDCPLKFAWQTGYSAFSVSESQRGRVRRYILDQERHHRRLTFAEEVRRFLARTGISENR